MITVTKLKALKAMSVFKEEKTSLIKILVQQVLESPNKNQMMAEVFQKSDDKEYRTKIVLGTSRIL